MNIKKKSKKKWWIIVCIPVVLLGLFVWAIGHFGPKYLNLYLFPPTVEGYGKLALERIDQNGLYAAGEEWQEAYPALLAELKTCTSYEDTYPVIERALAIGGGKHAFFCRPGEAAGGEAAEESLSAARLEDGILTVELPEFVGDAEAARAYAAPAQEFIHAHREEIRAAVVDLRDNTGGDLGPMLSAIAPLLPEGDLMYYHYRNYDLAVTLHEGVLGYAGSGSYILYPEDKLEVPVAILVNERTASSGEAALLCFAGMESARSFGAKTAGYTSVNMGYYLFDGAQMYLTVAEDMTREGEVFHNDPVEPDVPGAQPEQDALAWLKEQLGYLR